VTDSETGNRSKVKKSVSIAKCTKEHFAGTEEDLAAYPKSIFSNYFCIEHLDFDLKGNFFAEKFNYLEIYLELCYDAVNPSRCASTSEIEKYITGGQGVNM